MSHFSGKADVADFLDGRDLSTVTIRIIGTDGVIKPKEYKDIVPYLANLVGSMGSSQESTDMWITPKPSFLLDDDDYYELLLKRFKSKLKYAKSKAKKNGEIFDQDAFTDKFIRAWCWADFANEAREVIRRYLNKEPLRPYPLSNMSKFYVREYRKEMEKYGIDMDEWLKKWGEMD